MALDCLAKLRNTSWISQNQGYLLLHFLNSSRAHHLFHLSNKHPQQLALHSLLPLLVERFLLLQAEVKATLDLKPSLLAIQVVIEAGLLQIHRQCLTLLPLTFL